MSSGSWEEAVAWLRAQPGQGALVKAAFYDDPLKDAALRYYESTEWLAVRDLLPQPGDALDIGAGRGIATYALARDGWHTSALEPDPSNLVGAGAIRQLMAETGLKATVIENWGESLPFDDASFDLVHCRQVLHHAKDLPKLSAEIFRVLRSGGRMVATREHVISRKQDLPTFLNAHPLHNRYCGENAFLLSEYLSAIRDAGLSVTRVLNPLASDINTYPDTIRDVRQRLAGRAHVPAIFVPLWLVRLWGSMQTYPGRVYSFVAVKP